MEHLLPRQAWDLLQREPEALFIDCRTDAEFLFVGHPAGAMHTALYEGPGWDANPNFLAGVRKLSGQSPDRPVVLICRSGKRSVEAGHLLEDAGFTRVYNVLHGFEGDLDDSHQRGRINGWRFDGLPWQQT